MSVCETETRRSFALAVGVFDLFHVGHLRYLQHVRARCERLEVWVAADAVVAGRKGAAPLVPENERMELLRGLGWVDDVHLLPHSLDDTERTVERFMARGIERVFIGDDWRGTPRWQRLEPCLAELRIELVWVVRTEGVSTTRIKERVLQVLGGVRH